LSKYLVLQGEIIRIYLLPTSLELQGSVLLYCPAVHLLKHRALGFWCRITV